MLTPPRTATSEATGGRREGGLRPPLRDRLTPAERERIAAVLLLGRFDKAAALCSCDRDTISATWHAHRLQIGLELGLISEKPTP